MNIIWVKRWTIDTISHHIVISYIYIYIYIPCIYIYLYPYWFLCVCMCICAHVYVHKTYINTRFYAYMNVQGTRMHVYIKVCKDT